MIQYDDYIKEYHKIKGHSKRSACIAMGINIRHISNARPISSYQFKILLSYQDTVISSVKEYLDFDYGMINDFKNRLLDLINSKDFQKYQSKKKHKIINEYQRLTEILRKNG